MQGFGIWRVISTDEYSAKQMNRRIKTVFKQHLSVMALLFLAMFFPSCVTTISAATAKIHLDGDVDEPLRNELRGGIGFGNCQASHDKDRMIDSYVERYDLISEFMCFDVWGDAYLQVGLEYHYRLSRKWDIGVLADWGVSEDSYFAYYYPSGDAYSPDTNPDDWASANECCHFFVFAPSVRYTWYETNSSRYYSRIALGAMRHHLTFDYKRYPWNDYPSMSNSFSDMPSFTDSTDNIKWRMAYQLTAIGATIGSQSFNFFGEIGYGSLGIVRLGVGFMF